MNTWPGRRASSTSRSNSVRVSAISAPSRSTVRPAMSIRSGPRWRRCSDSGVGIVGAGGAGRPARARRAPASRTACGRSRRRPTRGRRPRRSCRARAVSITIGVVASRRIARQTSRPSIVRQHHVEEHEVRTLGAPALQSLDAVGGGGHREARRHAGRSRSPRGSTGRPRRAGCARPRAASMAAGAGGRGPVSCRMAPTGAPAVLPRRQLVEPGVRDAEVVGDLVVDGVDHLRPHRLAASGTCARACRGRS